MPYFVFEGLDGVGKTTTMQNVARELSLRGAEFVLTKEPGGPAALEKEWNYPEWANKHYGERYMGFRQLCVDHPEIPQVVKRALYRADAIYNWTSVVKPALDDDKLVLSDRSWVSDLAYGSVLTELSMHGLYTFNMALCPEMQVATKVIYLELHALERERRLAENMTNEMDKLGSLVRDKIAAAYEAVFEQYVSEQKLFRVSTYDLPSVVVENVLKAMFSK